MVNVKDGQYYYAPHRSLWGVWKAGETVNNARTDDFVKDFLTKEKAREFVYRMNNWN